MNHKEHLTNFINSLVSSGKFTVQRGEQLKVAMLADDVVQPLAEGVTGQSELSRRLGEVQTLEQSLRQQQSNWQDYYQRANTTLTQAEQARVDAERRASSAETAIRSLASQFNIPEEEVRAVYQFQSHNANPNPPNPNPQPSQFDPNRQRTQAPQVDPNAVTKQDLYGLIKDMALKDSLAAKHFTLTGKPWDSSKTLAYIEQQASLGRQVELEQAYRIVENVDALEATASAAAKEAERLAMRREIEAEIAAAQQGALPTDPSPNFAEAHLSSIFESTSSDQVDANGNKVAKEQTGHIGRTRLASNALMEMQRRRATGQKSQYESAS